jgi:hypothetical protein
MKSEITRAKYFAAMCLVLSLLAYAQLSTARQTLNSSQIGYVRLVSNPGMSAPAGTAIFGMQSTNGVLITETGAPFSGTVQSGRMFLEITSTMDAGIALSNSSSDKITVSYYFTDKTGQNFSPGSFVVAAHQQFSAFFSKAPFSITSPSAATMSFTASAPLGAVGLRSWINERQETLITTLPVMSIGKVSGGAVLPLPNAWKTTSLVFKPVLINPGDTQLSGTVTYFGAGSVAGTLQPVNVSINGVTASTFGYTLPPRSFVQFQALVPANSPAIESVHVVPGPNQGAPSAFAILYYRNLGITTSTAAVPAPAPAAALRAYLESTGTFGSIGSKQTMVTFENPSPSAIVVGMHVLKLDGTFSGVSASVNIPANGQVSNLATAFFPQLPVGFRGIVRITAPSPIVVTAIRNRFNERSELLMANTQPYDESSPALPEVDFPEFVRGGGYSTQVIMLSTGSTQSGAMYVVNQDGTVLPASTVRAEP